MDITQQELLQIIGEKELRIVLLQKEIARLQLFEQKFKQKEEEYDSMKIDRTPIPVAKRFSQLTEGDIIKDKP